MRYVEQSPHLPMLNLGDAANNLGGRIYVPTSMSIVEWEYQNADDITHVVSLATGSTEPEVVLHHRRDPLPHRTLISVLGKHAERVGFESGTVDFAYPDSLSMTEIVLDGAASSFYQISAGPVVAACARPDQIVLLIITSRAWMREHGRWPEMRSTVGTLRMKEDFSRELSE